MPLEQSPKNQYGKICISLYKLACFHEEFKKILNKNMHVYIAGIIERTSDPEYITKYSSVIARDVKELSKLLLKDTFDTYKNAHPYLVYKTTAEYNTFLLSKFDSEEKAIEQIILPKTCYNNASVFSRNLGHGLESDILEEMADSFEKYLRLLFVFDKEVVQNPKFRLTKHDYLDFKRDFMVNEEVTKIIPGIMGNLDTEDDGKTLM